MDTEGIGALDEDSNHDSRIFSLAVLISSYFIYNSVGAIDESALQNLSLVVNLTKHIHIRSQQNEETTSEEYGAYFPSFLWVVRDFSLKLENAEGETITSKEYIEAALQIQKGFSDIIEDKNRIRRLLKDFFKDRDCCTLVRPTINEEDLQNLESKEFEDLRLEFVEQIVQLRKKILGRCKIKSLNGKNLNGEMLANLIEAYVKAINYGAVPSIENAWTYICKTECTKSLQNAQDIYDKILLSSVSNRFPISEEELKMFHNEAKEAALEHFQVRAVGEEKESYLRQLKESLKEKISALKSDNEVETQRRASEFLSETYAIIDSKLKKGEFKTFLDYEKNMRSFQKYFLEHGPDGPCRREILLDFSLNKLASASDFFVKSISNELEMIEQTQSDRIAQLETV